MRNLKKYVQTHLQIELDMTSASLNIDQIQVNGVTATSFINEILTVDTSDSKDALLVKLEVLQSFRLFLMRCMDYNKLSNRNAKLEFIDFADNLNQRIEELEILSGQISQKELDTIAKNFSPKTQFPIGFTE
jgi:hypothetical protein